MPAELVVGRVGNELAAGDEDDGDGEEGDEEEDFEEGVDGEDEGREAGEETHALDKVAVETEFEFQGGLQSAQSPAGTLFEMSSESVWHGAELQSLVAEGGLPSET